ncbi:hypothetical protein CUC08_Gglean001394 [Alternaria sp. MG1]|nr:hypothetical protein CUC08_Gglean001394 [Alternaria sp. MG1]
MADIYEHAYMTIAATFAQDSNGGLFSSIRPLTTRLDKHPHLYIRECLPPFPDAFRTRDLTSWPLLTRAWVYQERRLSPRTVHFCKHQVYWECQTNFASEDASEYRVWRTDAAGVERDLGWGDKAVNSTRQWQKIVSEYTQLKLTYDSDRLPAIAALANRMSRLRQADDVYIAGMWRNSILSDLLWKSEPFKWGQWGQPLEPPSVRLVPSWSWASIQNAEISWSEYAFPDTTKVVSLDYTAIGAAHLGEVINASIVLRTHVLDLTGVVIWDPPWSNHSINAILRSSPRIDAFRRNNEVTIGDFFDQDRNLATANPLYMRGHDLKLLISKANHHSLGAVVVRQINEKPVHYERIGFLQISFRKTRGCSQSRPDETGWFIKGEAQRRIDELMRSFPVEEVRIV